MLGRRLLLAGGGSWMLLVAGFPSTGHGAGFAEGAQRFIEALADKAIATLTSKQLSDEERSSRFRTLLNEYFAIRTIGRWVLGRHWKRATRSQRSEYLRLFEDLIVATYADRFADYAGEALAVFKTTVRGGKDAIVSSRIRRPGASPIVVDWRVRARGQRYKIIDIMVAGISLGQTQRSEFSSLIRRNGGRIGALLTELRNRVKGMRGDGPA